MKKAMILTLALVGTMAHAGSYQYGAVTEFVAETDRVTFQIDTTGGADIRGEGCEGQPLNFSIDANVPGAQYMFDMVMNAKKTGVKIGVNGDGQCWAGGEFENAATIAFGE